MGKKYLLLIKKIIMKRIDTIIRKKRNDRLRESNYRSQKVVIAEEKATFSLRKVSYR
jgi:hypothetical protein